MPAGNAISVLSVEAAVPAATIGFRWRPFFVRLRRGKHIRDSDGLVPGEPAATAMFETNARLAVMKTVYPFKTDRIKYVTISRSK